MQYGSLFAGAGGFDLGFDAAGWQCVWQVEADVHARNVLSYRWPQATQYCDVRNIDGTSIAPVDVICGGFPCQDVSVAGRRVGLDGNRSNLFYDFVRIVEEMRHATNGLQPRWVVWENVAGLLSIKGALSTVYTRWHEVGAMVQEHRLVDGHYFGVPQRRRRIIGVVAFDPRTQRGPEILGESSRLPTNSRQVATTQTKSNRERRRSPTAGSFLAETGLVTALSASFRFGPDAAHAQAGWLVPTADGIRKLTPLECERLMGWPDDHTRWATNSNEIANKQRYKMCGNGMIAPMAQWAARRINKCEQHIANL